MNFEKWDHIQGIDADLYSQFVRCSRFLEYERPQLYEKVSNESSL